MVPFYRNALVLCGIGFVFSAKPQLPSPCLQLGILSHDLVGNHEFPLKAIHVTFP